MELHLAVEGDCGDVTWVYEPADGPRGFRLEDGVIIGVPNGQPRGEVLGFRVEVTRGVMLWHRIDIIIVDDENPDIEPCKPVPDPAYTDSEGMLRFRLRIGETVTTRIEAVGHCGGYQWSHYEFAEGTTFSDGVLTVTGDPSVVETSLYSVILRPEHGESWSLLFQITILD